ncbi:peptidylprolyl isomerase [uncultured Helcococcus sp.]|uniref:peptidylprolyl isomerase n=1 Tax=uncultured Helcococcus sp. TaxID=1072508 RepID=UPI00288AE66D|nr:peptidylprolyl isomerase [uncultured Helcococcus sp.]
MKKIKLLSLTLALALVLVGCSNGKIKTSEGDVSSEVLGKTNEGLEDLRAKKGAFLTVNGDEVSYSDFYKFYDLYSGILAMRQNLTEELTNLFVLDKIVSKELADNKIEVSQEELDKELGLYIQNLGSEEAFNNYLSMLGVSREVFVQNVLNSIKNTKHREMYASKLDISDKEINDYYEKNKDNIDSVTAKHILVEDEETAKTVKEKLDKGEDFKAVSDEYSIDTAAKAKGGDLGKVTRTRFDEDFVKGAFAVESGKISDPVKTQHGYHIIQVTENNVGLDKNKEMIKEALSTESYNQYIQEQVSKADIKFYDINGSVQNGNSESKGETKQETNQETKLETKQETKQETKSE